MKKNIFISLAFLIICLHYKAKSAHNLLFYFQQQNVGQFQEDAENTGVDQAPSQQNRDFSTSPNNQQDRVEKFENVDATYDVLKVGDFRTSEFPDMTVIPSKSRQKKALPYRAIREEDVLFRVKVWREIPSTEKINTPFRYEIEEANGDQRFIMILLKGIKEKKIKAYSAINDRFTTELSYSELPDIIVGEPKLVRLTDWEADPTGETKKDTIITEEFDPNSIEIYRVKEEWIFDKVTSKLYCRVMGIAPLKNIYNENGTFRDRIVLFWVHYPSCRDYFASWEVYNPKNLNQRMTWEELWEAKYFSSYITKSLLDNPYNLNIRSYITDPVLRLVESQNITNKIFDLEQAMWSY